MLAFEARSRELFSHSIETLSHGAESAKLNALDVRIPTFGLFLADDADDDADDRIDSNRFSRVRAFETICASQFCHYQPSRWNRPHRYGIHEIYRHFRKYYSLWVIMQVI